VTSQVAPPIRSTPKKLHRNRNFHPELLTAAIIYTRKQSRDFTVPNNKENMASFPANGIADIPPDHPKGDRVGAKPWLEPWLIKHSSFYRKHFTKGGDGLTKTERRASVVSMDEERLRRQSAVSSEESSGNGGGMNGKVGV
jgi:hypothetical protein